MAYYAGLGVRIDRVMTDNGSGYVSKAFRVACSELGIRHVRTRPYTPKTNGKAERFVQTSLREWAGARPYESSSPANPPAALLAPLTGIGHTRTQPPAAHEPHPGHEQPSGTQHLETRAPRR